MTIQYIYVSTGAIEYTLPLILTENDGKDITGDDVQVSLGTLTAPGSWVAPTVAVWPTPSSVSVQLLIGGSFMPTPGSYWLWVKITDSPEIPERRGLTQIVVA